MKDLHPSLRVPSKSDLVLGLKLAIIIVSILLVFFQDIAIIAKDALQSEYMSYIIAIPFLVGYLIYRKRKLIRASIPLDSSPSRKRTFPYKEIIGALLFLITFLIYFYGSHTFTPLEYHMFALPIFVAACILIMFNTHTLRQLAFPILFLLFLTPPPLQIVYSAGTALSTFGSLATCNILKALGLPASLTIQYGTPAIIIQKTGGSSLAFAMDITCSGIYSIIGFIIFATFLAGIARTSVCRKATIFLIGFPLIYMLNILRTLVIVLVGNYSGMELAAQTFHLLGGWFLIFVGTLLLLIVFEKMLKIRLFTTRSKTALCKYCRRNAQNRQIFCPACGKLTSPPKINLSKRDLTTIAIFAISVILIVNLQVPVFALAKGSAEVTIQTLGGDQEITKILPEVPGYVTKFIYRDKEFEEISQQDLSLTYAYIPANESETTIWITLEIAKTRSPLRNWEACITQETQLNLRDIQLLQNPPITARYFAFRESKTNLTQVILYWYENALFNTGSNPEPKHVKTSLIVYTRQPEDVNNVEEQLLPFGRAIANYWQPIKAWSQITLTIGQHGTTLIGIITILLAITLTFQAIKKIEEEKANLQVYNRLTLQEEKLILQAVHKAAEEGAPTGIAVASCYRKLAGKPIDLDVLLEKLDEARNAGLVRKEISNRDEEPTLIWKTQISFPKPSIIRRIISSVIYTPYKVILKTKSDAQTTDK